MTNLLQFRIRFVPLIGLLLLIISFTPVPVQSGKPAPCPQGGGGALNGLLNLFLPLVGACPPTFWAKTYGERNALSARATPDGGSIAAGLIHYGTPCCNDDFKVLRLDGDGNIVWQKTYGGSKLDRANSVDVAIDGTLIVAGGTTSFTGGTFWVLHLDANGSIPGPNCKLGQTSTGVTNNSGLLTADTSVVATDSAATTTSTTVTGVNSTAKVSKQCVG